MLSLVVWASGNFVGEHVEVIRNDEIDLPTWPNRAVYIFAHFRISHYREEHRMWTAFEYMYRDAGNFKAFGVVIIEGALTEDDQELIRSRLSSEEYFIAEQVRVPPLYDGLYQWSGGRTASDHCWHEYVGLREVANPVDSNCVVSAREFVSRFAQVQRWNESLSPHFG